MNCESEAANLWAAMLGLALLIAMTITCGYWLTVYHREAAEMTPFVVEPPSAIELILDDLWLR